MLLDTQSLLWTLNGGEEFGSHARSLLARATDAQYSSISIAEIRIKQLLGKLSVPDDLLLRIEEAGLRTRGVQRRGRRRPSCTVPSSSATIRSIVCC